MADDQEPDAAAMLAAAHNGALRLLNHLSRYSAPGGDRVVPLPDPNTLPGAIAALRQVAGEIEKESASR